jgi:hypothetical protein
MATVGELAVNLRAATASFSEDMDKAQYLFPSRGATIITFTDIVFGG